MLGNTGFGPSNRPGRGTGVGLKGGTMNLKPHPVLVLKLLALVAALLVFGDDVAGYTLDESL